MDFKERIVILTKKVKRNVKAIIITMKMEDTPILAKIFGMMTVVYALSPIDLIPDFIPVLGYLDDLIILPILASLTIKFIPPDIWEKALFDADRTSNKEPKKWYYSIPIVLIWLLVIYFLLKRFNVL
ncbi:MAG: DUF1232 domain-containing protein [Clostridiaceae bacterium]